MKTYHLSSAYYAALKQRLLLTAVPIVAAAGAVGYLAGSWQGGVGLGYAAVFVLITGIFFAFTIPRNYRQQRELAQSYKLTLQDNTITRTQAGAQEISIARGNIARITELPGRGLALFAANSRLRFGIPATLEGYAELRATLESWHRIEAVASTGLHWQAVAVPLIALAIVGLFAIAIISNDKVLVTVSGLAAIIVSVASALVLWNSAQVDTKTKSRLWLISIPLLGVVAKVIYTLVS